MQAGDCRFLRKLHGISNPDCHAWWIPQCGGEEEVEVREEEKRHQPWVTLS